MGIILRIVIVIVVPRHEPEPGGPGIPLFVHRRHASVLRERQHLVRIKVGNQPEYVPYLACVRNVVDVFAYDVNISVARVERCVQVFRAGSLAGPHPDEVVQPLLLEVVVHISPELYVGLGSVHAPPEPGSAVILGIGVSRCFVQRTPDYRYARILEELEISGYLGEVGIRRLLLPAAFFEYVCRSEKRAVASVSRGAGIICRAL